MLKIFGAILVFLPSVALSDVNETTDKYTRNKYSCQIASTPMLKPNLKGFDFIRADAMDIGYADLTLDGLPEIISGASDETYILDDAKFFADNASRSRKAHQYSFYSTNSDFVPPNGTKFMLARTMLTQDFNGDGKDDVAFVEHGPDQAPYEPRRNEIMLSGPSGYKVKYLPGPVSLYHGGAAGDIDGDGDVDIVVTPGPNNEVYAYINDGKGNFKIRTLFTDIGRNYNIKLWDFDTDGKLDILIDGELEPLTVFWGDGNGHFSQKSIISEISNSDTMMDIASLSKGSEKVARIAVLTGLSLGRGHSFFGYDISELEFAGRTIVASKKIDRLEEASWLPWISSCDLRNDGDVDLVSEFFGEPRNFFITMGTWKYLDKIVWVNEEGKFTRTPLENSMYFSDKPEIQVALKKYAEDIGVSLEKYDAQQVYYPSRGNIAMSTIELTDAFRTPWFMQTVYEKALTAFPHTAKDGLKAKAAIGQSVAQTPDPNNVSEKVKAILLARKKAKASP